MTGPRVTKPGYDCINKILSILKKIDFSNSPLLIFFLKGLQVKKQSKYIILFVYKFFN